MIKTNLTKTFLDLKFKKKMINYPFIFVLQHNNLTAFTWKEIKKQLNEKMKIDSNQTKKEIENFKSIKPFVIYIIPKKNSKNIFPLSIQSLENPVNGPCCFFGCFNLEDFSIFRDVLKNTKTSFYSFFEIGVYTNKDLLFSKNETSNLINYTFFHFLEIEKKNLLIKKALTLKLLNPLLGNINSYALASNFVFSELFFVENSLIRKYIQFSKISQSRISEVLLKNQLALINLIHLIHPVKVSN
jgi:hypothetical protein